MKTSIDAHVAAQAAGGNAIYADLKPGDRFHFPKRPAIVFEKLKGGWYTRVAGATLAYPRPKFRTGSRTAVVQRFDDMSITVRFHNDLLNDDE